MERTSLTDPLRIAELPVGSNGGAVGVTFAPGKHQAQAITGIWARDLDTDLQAIRDWGAQHLITLIEPQEFTELKVGALPDRARAHGLIWDWLPIVDGRAPDHRLLTPWRTLGPSLVHRLQAGSRLVVHCKGGLGRAGTVAAMLLLDSGTVESADEAIASVRSVRPGAVETLEQEHFLRSLAWREQHPQRLARPNAPDARQRIIRALSRRNSSQSMVDEASALEAAHRGSYKNRATVEVSSICGCFHCLSTFDPKEVTQWIDGPIGAGMTALCPRCGIDSVLGSASAPTINARFLTLMRDYWFSQEP